MDKEKTAEATIKLCPYRNDAPCVEADCPAWIDEEGFQDCLFNVALTETKGLFLEGARFLDEKLGLLPGQGRVALQGVKDALGSAGKAAGAVMIGAILGAMAEGGALDDLVDLSSEDAMEAMRDIGSLVNFGFALDFSREDEEEDDEEEDEF